jgi:hypothetical protein
MDLTALLRAPNTSDNTILERIQSKKFCFVVVVVLVLVTLLRILHYCPISPCFQHIAPLHCLAALPDSLARQPCPEALPGSIDCLAALQKYYKVNNRPSRRVASRSFVRQNCKLFYGRRPSSSVAYFYLPALVQVFPAILSLVYKLIRERG